MSANLHYIAKLDYPRRHEVIEIQCDESRMVELSGPSRIIGGFGRELLALLLSGKLSDEKLRAIIDEGRRAAHDKQGTTKQE